jgi:hypothetical protein
MKSDDFDSMKETITEIIDDVAEDISDVMKDLSVKYQCQRAE